MLVFKPERFDLGEYDSHPISVCGKSFVADMSGALFWPGKQTLIISDLHFEKAPPMPPKGGCYHRTIPAKRCCGSPAFSTNTIPTRWSPSATAFMMPEPSTGWPKKTEKSWH